MYPMKAIANFFIDRAMKEGAEMSPMKIQKLLYFAYGIYHVKTGEPLFSDRFEVWKYGPVISELYHLLKGYGSDQIDRLLPDFDMATMRVVTPTIPREEKELLVFLTEFWEVYRGYSPIRLSNATHLPGTPWDEANRAGEKVISDQRMDAYFSGLVQ
ncbi:MAG: type II toxin-antitoxin system antitoxin SocA domain-containing protein [Bacteroidota bacterium]